MAKPKAIQWLEEQTGEDIDFTPEPNAAGRDRHLSVRVPSELAEGLDVLAAGRGLTVSQLVRALLAVAVEQRTAVTALDSRALADRLAADVAEVRRRLAG